MPTHWKRVNDNELRAHLQEALAERRASRVVEDWSYSGYDLSALREELRERQAARAAAQAAAERAAARPNTFRLSY